MNYSELSKRVAEHASLFFIEHTDKRLFYHNQTHFTEMLDSVKKMASHYKLDERDNFIVCAAAWFHDTGYLLTGPGLHETKSAELAGTFLKSLDANDEDIEAVTKCILATQIPQSPVTLNEKIVCDADLYNLGTEAFKEKNKMVKKEAEVLQNRKISGGEWRAHTIELMEKHSYHTDYCQSRLNKTKADNLRKIRLKHEEKLWEKQFTTVDPPPALDDHPEATEQTTTGEPAENDFPVEEEKIVSPEIEHLPRQRKNERPIRGVETMFRISSTNYQRLSVMADNKAHIMISVNAIIISVAIGLVLGKFGQASYLVVPTVMLLTVNLLTITFSILATRPKRSPGVFTKEQVEKKAANLLFFGSFYKMSFNEYQNGMRKMMVDTEFLNNSLLKDLFWQGRVLGRKFHLLRISYDIFMYGIVLSVISYIVSYILSIYFPQFF